MNIPSEYSQRALWRLRWKQKILPRSDREIAYRLNRISEPNSEADHFNFPWGIVEYGSASDLRGQFQEIYLDRHYAFNADSEVPVILDCGGNIGMSAIWFRQNYPKCKLTVVEADSSLVKRLSKNFVSCGIHDAKVLHGAVWNRDGKISFDARGNDSGLVSEDGEEQIPCFDIAELISEQVDLLKMDIEGAEYPVIERLAKSGKIANVKRIAAEFHMTRAQTPDFARAIQTLHDSGMQVALTAKLGPWLGQSDQESAFEIVGRNLNLMDVYAWR